MLCYAILYYTILYDTILYYTIMYYILWVTNIIGWANNHFNNMHF